MLKWSPLHLFITIILSGDILFLVGQDEYKVGDIVVYEVKGSF